MESESKNASLGEAFALAGKRVSIATLCSSVVKSFVRSGKPDRSPS